ncbi:MAG: hypothetical protein K1W30_00090 [Lachnospiraceae bacterium]
MRLCKDCANRGKKEICQIHTSVSNYAERCKDFEQKESIGQIVKSVAQIVQQVSEDICDNYCKYRDTADEENLCALIRNGGKCPLDLLN